jgi:hypothetical protein
MALKGQFYTDPQFIKLYQDYESAGRVLRKAIEDAVWLLSRDPQQDLVGPRRRVDLFNLNETRRTYENAAYRVVTYKPGITQILPSQTFTWEARALLKDATMAQHLGMDWRTEEYLDRQRDLLENQCLLFYREYELQADPKPEDAKRRLIDILEVLQAVMPERDIAVKFEKELSRLINNGQLKPDRGA